MGTYYNVKDSKHQLRSIGHELSGCIFCYNCLAPYTHQKKKSASTGKSTDKYVCYEHNRNCSSNSARSYDADYLEFIYRCSLFMAIKLGEPMLLKTMIDKKDLVVPNGKITPEFYIYSNIQQKKKLMSGSLMRGRSYIMPHRRKKDIEVITIIFTNRIQIEVTTYPPKKHNLQDMSFILKRRGNLVKRIPDTIIETGIFHPDHTVEFLHKDCVSDEKYTSEWFDEFSTELNENIKLCEKMTEQITQKIEDRNNRIREHLELGQDDY